MLLGEPMLANREATTLPKPYIKWSYQPTRAADVPGAVARGIAIANQAPKGPIYLSIPMDDWDMPIDEPQSILSRILSTRVGPDPEHLAQFAEQIRGAQKPALILGAEVDKTLSWDAAISLAESLRCAVFQAPLSERCTFPATHGLFRGALPAARGPLSDALRGFDLVLVIGAEVFRYYPWVPGPVLPNSTTLLHITEDPNDAAKALCGHSLVSDVRLAIEGLNRLLQERDLPARALVSTAIAKMNVDNIRPKAQGQKSGSSTSTTCMTAADAFQIIGRLRPAHAILVHETPSNTADLIRAWCVIHPESCFTFGSGGLGWNAPAAVGIALAQQRLFQGRHTVLVVGDGSIQYSIQSIYTAVQFKVKLIYIVPVNEEYAVLKEFAELEGTPNVPWLDIPGLNIGATARAFGCPAWRAESGLELERMFKAALEVDGPVLIEFPIRRGVRSLLESI